MKEIDFNGSIRIPENVLEIEPWAKAENMEMVLGQNELWSRNYGVACIKKKHNGKVPIRIRYAIAHRLHQLADYIEPDAGIHRERYV